MPSDWFVPGDVVKVKELIEFIDGTKHHKGQLILVTSQTVAYFNVRYIDFEYKFHLKTM